MRYRIAKKKMNKNTLLGLWCKSTADWIFSDYKAKKLAHDDFWCCIAIAAEFTLYDWERICLIGKKMGIKERMLKRYRDEFICKIHNGINNNRKI